MSRLLRVASVSVFINGILLSGMVARAPTCPEGWAMSADRTSCTEEAHPFPATQPVSYETPAAIQLAVLAAGAAMSIPFDREARRLEASRRVDHDTRR